MHRVHFNLIQQQFEDGDGDVSYCELSRSKKERKNPYDDDDGVPVVVTDPHREPPLSSVSTERRRHQQQQLNMTAEVEELLQYLNQFNLSSSHCQRVNNSALLPQQHSNFHESNQSARSALIPLSPDDDSNSNASNGPVLDLSAITRQSREQTTPYATQQATISPNEKSHECNDSTASDGGTAPQNSFVATKDAENVVISELYRQARAERTAARHWAAQLRTAVTAWARSVAVELQTAASTTDTPHETATETIQYYQRVVSELQDQKVLEREEHRSMVLSLHEIIRHQQARLTVLEQTSASLPVVATENPAPEENYKEHQRPSITPPTTSTPSQSHTKDNKPQAHKTRNYPNTPAPTRFATRHQQLLPAVSLSFLSDDLSSLNGDDGLKGNINRTNDGLKGNINRTNDSFRASTSRTKPTTPSTNHRSRTSVTTDGCQVISYGNGSIKEIYTNHHDDSSSPSVQQEVIRYQNGDVQTTTKVDQAYYFAASGVIQVVQRDDRAESVQYHFPNGQVEEHWADCQKIVWFPDGTIQHFDLDNGSNNKPVVLDNAKETAESRRDRRRSPLDQVDGGYSFACTV